MSNPSKVNLDRLVKTGKSLTVDFTSIIEENQNLRQALDGARAQSKPDAVQVNNAHSVELKLQAKQKELTAVLEKHRRVGKQLTAAQESLHKLEAAREVDLQSRDRSQRVIDFQREEDRGETIDLKQKIAALEARVANLRVALQRSKKTEAEAKLALEKEKKKEDRKGDHDMFIKRQLVVMTAVDKGIDDMRAKIFESWSVPLPQESSRKNHRA